MSWLAQNWVWVAVLIAALLFMMLRAAHHDFRGFGGSRPRSDDDYELRPGEWRAAEHARAGCDARSESAYAIDPVSHKAIATQHATTSYYRERVYFFENEENRRRFEAAPEQFANDDASLPPGSLERPRSRYRRRSC